MEAIPDRTPAQRRTPPRRQLPTGKNKVERIGRQTKGLFDDFTEWMEIRLRLVQLDIQEKIRTKANEAAIRVAPFIAGALAGLFMLVTTALFLGWWLGHPAWGFLIVTGMLLLVAGILYAKSKKLDADKEHDVDWSKSDGENTNRDQSST